MLSSSVVTSLQDAELNLRNALAFAARGERPFVAKSIASMISEIDSLQHADKMIDNLDKFIEESDE